MPRPGAVSKLLKIGEMASGSPFCTFAGQDPGLERVVLHMGRAIGMSKKSKKGRVSASFVARRVVRTACAIQAKFASRFCAVAGGSVSSRRVKQQNPSAIAEGSDNATQFETRLTLKRICV